MHRPHVHIPQRPSNLFYISNVYVTNCRVSAPVRVPSPDRSGQGHRSQKRSLDQLSSSGFCPITTAAGKKNSGTAKGGMWGKFLRKTFTKCSGDGELQQLPSARSRCPAGGEIG